MKATYPVPAVANDPFSLFSSTAYLYMPLQSYSFCLLFPFFSFRFFVQAKI